MMVENPIEYLKPWFDAGFKRFIGHVEGIPDQVEFISQAKHFGEVGLAFDGPSPLDKLKVPVENLDYLLFMTIKSGFSGQPFMPEVLEKIKTVRAQSSIPIEVDGGINDQTILLAKEAGANRYAATSFIYKSQDPKGQYEKLVSLVKKTGVNE